jgi:putative transposon-encoded protein
VKYPVRIYKGKVTRFGSGGAKIGASGKDIGKDVLIIVQDANRESNDLEATN